MRAKRIFHFSLELQKYKFKLQLKIKNLNAQSMDMDIEQTKFKHRNPFENMQIDKNEFLHDVEGRSPCPKCHKSRKFYCYTCYVPVERLIGRFPVVKVFTKMKENTEDLIMF